MSTAYLEDYDDFSISNQIEKKEYMEIILEVSVLEYRKSKIDFIENMPLLLLLFQN